MIKDKEVIEKNLKCLEILEDNSLDFKLFFFIATFNLYYGLLLYKQSIIEEVILLIEEIGYKELYLFSNNLYSKGIAKLILNEIKKNYSIDWNLKISARAKIRVIVKRILKKYGYPPDKANKTMEKIIKQAELVKFAA